MTTERWKSTPSHPASQQLSLTVVTLLQTDFPPANNNIFLSLFHRNPDAWMNKIFFSLILSNKELQMRGNGASQHSGNGSRQIHTYS
jgi:hypothetical protein